MERLKQITKAVKDGRGRRPRLLMGLFGVLPLHNVNRAKYALKILLKLLCTLDLHVSFGWNFRLGVAEVMVLCQVLMMYQLPDTQKAYSMFFIVEKQRSVHINLADSTSHTTYQLALKENRRQGVDRYVQREKPFMDTKSLACTQYHKSDHLKDSYFQLHGVLDWYKSLANKDK
ncbi:UNVERIFIED_CONTAM: hypothetical protein Sradi_3302700 [Sesamum radiatum]|uniref:Uncharacterized protein n=1 Tax=Sesamum radiatum TaxID=300843 RepID=A0AAW2R1I8_SESRA